MNYDTKIFNKTTRNPQLRLGAVTSSTVMDLEGRKNNTYFDQSGKQILVGDLLKVFHFRSRNRNYYMYHVVVMEETEPFPVMAIKAHYADKPHYRLYSVADNIQRIYHDAKIISFKHHDAKREKIKVFRNAG